MFGDNLKELRKKANLTQKQLADRLKLAESTIGMYERNERQPSFEILEEIADLFNVDMNYLHGYYLGDKIITGDNFNFVSIPTAKIPIVGHVACGEPLLTDENIIGYMDPIDYVKADFCLIAKGDSMIDADIHENDIVFVQQTEQVDNGEIAVVLIGEEATLKKYRNINGKVMLIPANDNYEPIFIEEESTVKILGRATHIMKVIGK